MLLFRTRQQRLLDVLEIAPRLAFHARAGDGLQGFQRLQHIRRGHQLARQIRRSVGGCIAEACSRRAAETRQRVPARGEQLLQRFEIRFAVGAGGRPRQRRRRGCRHGRGLCARQIRDGPGRRRRRPAPAGQRLVRRRSGRRSRRRSRGRRGGGVVHGARAARHEHQSRQDAFAREELVQRFRPLVIVVHHLQIEGAVEQQTLFQIQFQRARRLLEHAAEALRADRELFLIERRRAAKRTEALAEQQQRMRGAGFMAAGDIAQDDLFVHDRVFHQRQRAVFDRAGTLRRLGGMRRADRSQFRFQREDEVRHEFVAVALERAQVAVEFRLPVVAARRFRLLEQRLLEFRQHRVQGLDDIRGDVIKETAQYPAHPWRQRRTGDGRRCNAGQWRSRCGHRCCGSPPEGDNYHIFEG